MKYELIDSGEEMKLERFGPVVLARPCAQALWKRSHREEWQKADGTFSRDDGNRWSWKKSVPKSWVTEHDGLKFKIMPTDFGHLGLFPEHANVWQWASGLITKGTKVLNLFAYSGGATLACARAGAEVCHLDASKGMVSWARENAVLCGLDHLPIRWIVDDAMKFLKREQQRGRRYEGIILDPPSFGRGAQGEVFKIERDLGKLLEACHAVLVDQPLFVAFSTHTPGMTPLVMNHLMEEMMGKGKIQSGEMVLKATRGKDIPSGSFATWQR